MFRFAIARASSKALTTTALSCGLCRSMLSIAGAQASRYLPKKGGAASQDRSELSDGTNSENALLVRQGEAAGLLHPTLPVLRMRAFLLRSRASA